MRFGGGGPFCLRGNHTVVGLYHGGGNDRAVFRAGVEQVQPRASYRGNGAGSAAMTVKTDILLLSNLSLFQVTDQALIALLL